MPDKKEVLKALVCRVNDPVVDCTGCPYNESSVYWKQRCDFHRICRDAVELLQQKPVKPDEVFVNNPSPEPDQWLFICPICTNDVEKGDHYCKHCGRELKWDD